MAKYIKRIAVFISLFSLSLSADALAGAFQLWEQDGASVGNYHAGRAAIAEDVSTAYYNPAGLVRIHHQQLVVSGDPILTDIKFRGTVQVDTLTPRPLPATAQGGGFNIVPSFHYAAPLCDNLVLGLSVVSPFGLKTDYGNATDARYSATLTSATVIDLSPSFGFALTDQFSLGLGLDFERLYGYFNLVATAFDELENTQARNKGSSNAIGAHAGALYQFSPVTRLGMSYHSKLVHHVGGNSTFEGPLANEGMGGRQFSPQFRLNFILPATTTLSVFHALNPCWEIMGTLIYSQWNVVQDLTLKNLAGIEHGESTNTIIVTIPQHLRNTWNIAVGANYHLNDQIMLRTGGGFDQSPVKNKYRNLQLPDSNRIALAIGGQYQATNDLSIDLGWSHIFAMNTRINHFAQKVGDQTTTTNGSLRANADVYALQFKYNFT